MTLDELVAGLPAARLLHATAAARGATAGTVHSDSRAVTPGDVFVAVRGLRADGHDFVATAIAQGAIAVVVERELADVRVPQLVLPAGLPGSRALGILVARRLGDPSKRLVLVGITGTNGKTTTTFLVETILAAAGHRVGVIGTVTYRWPGTAFDAPYTTPTPQILHETFARMLADGVTHVVMETSSIALEQDRLAGIDFAVGAFSNLTQDHLDVHGSMAAYAAAKQRLFDLHLAGGTAVVNVDDPAGPQMVATTRAKVLRVSATGQPAEIRVVAQDSSVRGITATIATPRGELAIEARPLIGRYNVDNLALATGIAEALGIPHATIARGIASLRGVPGRVERVDNLVGLDIFVDYAHTPDALRNVLAAMRPLATRRLICVFGCGGDRDPSKRPLMGAAVTELADLAVVTSDNPRTEEPRAILDQILPGVPNPFFVHVDRRTAIRAAIAEATPGDIVVIAGKGHEDYQIVGTTKHHFDDREEAAAACALRSFWTPAQIGRALDLPVAYPETPRISRVLIDSRAVAPGDLYIAIRGEQHDGHLFSQPALAAGAAAIMVEAGTPLPAGDHVAIVVDETRLAIGKLAHAHRRTWDGKLVAITGSAGKTTTKDLTRAALAECGATHAALGSLNNETGVPLTLLGLHAVHAYGVLEMGMRGAGQIEYLTRIAEPDVAVVVNAGTAHLELLGTTDAIAAAKSEIWLGLREGGTVVRPVDDPRLEAHARAHQPRARHVTFGERDADVTLVEYTPTERGGQLVLDVFGERAELTLGLVGRHAALDACAAIAAAHAAGGSIAQILAGVARAKPPAMRGEIVDLGGRRVIVDCYNANPASMAAAMRALAERKQAGATLAVVGDMLELGDHAAAAHRDVGALAQELGIELVAIGDQAPRVVEAAGPHAVRADSVEAAASRALARTSPGDWILLKASRGMRLERVLAAMRTQLAKEKP